MKKAVAGIWVAGVVLLGACAASAVPIHVTHLWHMHQPIYFPYESVRNTDSNSRYNFNVEGSVWDGDRYNCYRNWPKDAVEKAVGKQEHGGSQMSYSGSLAENNTVIWGDPSGWAANIRYARNSLRTSRNNPRLDTVGIAYHHSLMPLTSVESMRMQIKLHKEQYKDLWNTGGEYSKGFWPPECAFDNSMVPALVAEGLEWVIVDNGHLFRTVSDFEWSSGSSCRPNRADVRNGSSTNLASTWVGLQNVWAPTKVLAPWSYQPHYVRHVDPWTGVTEKIVAVPAGRYEGNENGRGGYGAFKPENVWGSQIAANNNAAKPMLLLCHSDGDNYGMKNADAWNGQQQNFVDMCAANADFEYTSVQDYLGMFPPDPNDVIHVEPGSWIGIDGGTPYYEKWLSYENRSGEMPDMWSWSMLVSAQNRVLTADDLENSYLSGGKDMNDVEWGIGNDTARAWHYYLNGETSCYWYWDFDRANPWDGNVTRACNMAIAEAQKVLNAHSGSDPRGPSIFPPQRNPYNPGGKMWNESSNAASDFLVWSFIDDASDVRGATLYWRKDNDGNWPISSTENETYAGGAGVGPWQTVAMTNEWWPTVQGPQVPTPSDRAQRYSALVAGQTNCLIDYFVEAVDTKGNTNRSNIIHVWVGDQAGSSGEGGGTNVAVWIRSTYNYPAAGDVTADTPLFVNAEAGPSGAVTRVTLGYSLDNGTNWIRTNMAANAEWASVGGQWFNSSLGLFAAGTTIKYFIEATDGVTTNWDNNRNQNYTVTVSNGSGGVESLWVGNVAHAPPNGYILPTNHLVVSCESWPIGAATNVALVYSANGGANWQAAAFAKTGEARNNDLWSLDMGTFPTPTTIVYCVSATSSNAWTVWDNNGSANYVAVVGEIGGLRMVPWTPGINVGHPATNADNANDIFDFDTTGGAATTRGTNGFGSFGHVYVNFDATNLYVGGSGVALPDDSTNNAYVVFLSGGAIPGTNNLWQFNGAPEGIDHLHNLNFIPAANVAILLGDVRGDGTSTNFDMYSAGFEFGQGVFALPASGTAFDPVEDAKLSQFGGYGPGNWLAANWECAIPLSTFGVTNAASLTNLYLSGLMVTRSTSNTVNRFISGKYLGANATLGNDEQPDAWGNFGFSYVDLTGIKVDPAELSTETLGVPNSWIAEHLPPGHGFTGSSDYDGDGIPDRHEYFAGMDPDVSNRMLRIDDVRDDQMRMEKSGAQMCQYVLEAADRLTNGGWNFAPYATLPSTNGVLALPDFTVSNVMLRVKIVVPTE